MSNVVGSLTLREFKQNGEAFGGFGHLSMLAHQFKFGLQAFVSQNPNAPRFVAMAKTPDERLIEIGKVWVKLIKQGEFEGKEMFSLTFDDASFARPLNVAAFPTAEPGIYEIVWQRPKQVAKPLAQATAGADTDSGPLF
ncbi:DUF736 family protein [Ferrovibrio terrae]|uniref:DUF736 family protein n=1 Tax=Ferrovibrio terrae TaxID=2594003 RepID=UPI00313819CC